MQEGAKSFKHLIALSNTLEYLFFLSAIRCSIPLTPYCSKVFWQFGQIFQCRTVIKPHGTVVIDTKSCNCHICKVTIIQPCNYMHSPVRVKEPPRIGNLSCYFWYKTIDRRSQPSGSKKQSKAPSKDFLIWFTLISGVIDLGSKLAKICQLVVQNIHCILYAQKLSKRAQMPQHGPK